MSHRRIRVKLPTSSALQPQVSSSGAIMQDSMLSKSSSTTLSSSPSSPFAPFRVKMDQEDCVIFQSSDSVNFFVHPYNVKLTSPVLSTTLTADLATLAKAADGTPIIRFDCDSAVLNLVVRLISPAPDVVFADTRQVMAVRKVADAYDIAYAKSRTEAMLLKARAEDPLLVFALALSMDMKVEAVKVAKHMVDTNLLANMDGLPYHPEMDDRLTAGAYCRFVSFLQQKGGPLFPFTLSTVSFASPQAAPPSPRKCIDPPPLLGEEALRRHPYDLVIHSSCDATVQLFAHKWPLEMASPVLAETISKSTEKTTGGISVITLPENGDVLHTLVSCCSGAIVINTSTNNANVRSLIHLAHAATKYGVSSVIKATKATVDTLLNSHPLQLYLIAFDCGWESMALRAMDKISVEYAGMYLSYMEESSAKGYHRLLKYRRDRKRAGLAARDKFMGTGSEVVPAVPEEKAVLVAQSTAPKGLDAGAKFQLVPSFAPRNDSLVLFKPQSRISSYRGVEFRGNLSAEETVQLKAAIDAAMDAVKLEFK
ncbi:hypothetical protein BXZ70DRAFT_955102 [Cristinia sonorae]|uniref:BTB domain-containing protein n=1 Tax=Cristinia sonorae TaxID=1940300 RepID=A0A8K0UGH2_9AGAR|nr:hypothetical protein BXZ70DRAFT_955102 [Cristinia sonorae]